MTRDNQATWDRPDDVHISAGGVATRDSSSSVPAFVLAGSCSFKHRGITAIIGPVGSGKSTLLLSLLGETKVNPKLLSIFFSINEAQRYCKAT